MLATSATKEGRGTGSRYTNRHYCRTSNTGTAANAVDDSSPVLLSVRCVQRMEAYPFAGAEGEPELFRFA